MSQNLTAVHVISLQYKAENQGHGCHIWRNQTNWKDIINYFSFFIVCMQVITSWFCFYALYRGVRLRLSTFLIGSLRFTNAEKWPMFVWMEALMSKLLQIVKIFDHCFTAFQQDEEQYEPQGESRNNFCPISSRQKSNRNFPDPLQLHINFV